MTAAGFVKPLVIFNLMKIPSRVIGSVGWSTPPPWTGFHVSVNVWKNWALSAAWRSIIGAIHSQVATKWNRGDAD